MSLPELAELQRALVRRIRTGEGDALHPRVHVYEEMYFLRLREALAAYYPRLVAALGGGFDELARRYFDAHPSRHPSLRYIGAHLASFLHDDAELAAIAAVETARLDVFDASDVPVLTMDRVQATPPDAFAQLPIHLVPAHRIVGDLLIGRYGVGVYERRLEPLEAAILASLDGPTAFGVVCERIAARAGEGDAPRLGCEMLLRWVTDQLLAAE